MFKCIIIIILLVVLYTLNRINNYSEYFSIPTGHERPFVNVFDNNKNQIKIILLSHPFTRDSSYKQYEQYKKDKFLILGIASYNEFPKITTNKLDTLSNPTEKAWTYDYMKVVDGWLHCFRTPDKYIEKIFPEHLYPNQILQTMTHLNLTNLLKKNTTISMYVQKIAMAIVTAGQRKTKTGN